MVPSEDRLAGCALEGAALSHVGSGCEGSAPASSAPTAPPPSFSVLSGLTATLLSAHLRDLANPLAVPRLEIARRNAKLGEALMKGGSKAPILARKIAELAAKPGPDEIDVRNMMRAADKRRRRLAKRLSMDRLTSKDIPMPQRNVALNIVEASAHA